MAVAEKYEPRPRYGHCAAAAEGRVYLWAGYAKDFHEKEETRAKLSSEIESFDPLQELWLPPVSATGDPPPGLVEGAIAAAGGILYHYGGNDGRSFFNALSKFECATHNWSLLSKDSRGPMRKCGCGMVCVGDLVWVLAGYGLPSGPTQPGSTFIKSTAYSDGSGWTNEVHCFHTNKGEWSSPAFNGTRPSPRAHFTLTLINTHQAIVFAGFNGEQGELNDAILVDFVKMHCSTLVVDGELPVPRQAHAASCLNYNDSHPQLLISGGLGRLNEVLRDCWMLCVVLRRWRKVDLPHVTRARAGHSLTAVSLGEGLTETVSFGGVYKWPENLKTLADYDPYLLADTTVMRFERRPSPPSAGSPKWALTDVANNTQRGSRERVRDKKSQLALREALIKDHSFINFSQDPLSEDPTSKPHPPVVSKEPAAPLASTKPAKPVVKPEPTQPKSISKDLPIAFTKPAVPVSTHKEPVVIPFKALELKEAIGEGSFGLVRKGYWTSSDGSKHLVAVKQLKGLDKNEVKILSALDHPNIITLYGTSENSGLQYIVTDYAENGSLQDFISSQPCTPDLKRTLPWAKQVADGMLYLHHRGIAHRDLKSNNVVLTSNWVAKICDLGTARTLDHTTRMTSSVGTMAFIAPEIMMKKPASKMCDVYSYGILLWELATHDQPFKGLPPLLIPSDVVKGVRPPIPESTDVGLKELIEKCWQGKPEDRPVFESILYSLEECEMGKMEYGELEFTKRVGSGGFGVVSKGFWNTKKAGKLLVAIKNTSDMEDEKEVKVLSSLRHPNFTHFYGSAKSQHHLSLVTEFAENGSVAGYISARKGKPEKEPALKWGKEIAEGMRYLHERGFVHRDLKSHNVVLTSEWTAKICDLGTARKLKSTIKQTMAGTFAWIAPELLREEPASTKCDVYSYAIVLWELVSFQVPFEGVADIVILMSVAKGERPLIPSDCDQFFSDLIKRCWVDNYKERPSFDGIMEAWQH